jgi:hypothetical protein
MMKREHTRSDRHGFIDYKFSIPYGMVWYGMESLIEEHEACESLENPGSKKGWTYLRIRALFRSGLTLLAWITLESYGQSYWK